MPCPTPYIWTVFAWLSTWLLSFFRVRACSCAFPSRLRVLSAWLGVPIRSCFLGIDRGFYEQVRPRSQCVRAMKNRVRWYASIEEKGGWSQDKYGQGRMSGRDRAWPSVKKTYGLVSQLVLLAPLLLIYTITKRSRHWIFSVCAFCIWHSTVFSTHQLEPGIAYKIGGVYDISIYPTIKTWLSHKKYMFLSHVSITGKYQYLVLVYR